MLQYPYRRKVINHTYIDEKCEQMKVCIHRELMLTNLESQIRLMIKILKNM